METSKGKSSTKAKNKYNAQNYDNIRLVVPKGRKADISAVAKTAGSSLNGFISDAIDGYIIGNKYSLKKVYTIVGGVNGTGKSSFIGAQGRSSAAFGVIIDAAKITAVNKVFPIEGENMAEQFIHNCLDDEISFAQEATLAEREIKYTAAKAKDLGYYVRLNYIALDSPEECLKRISNRAARGGNDIGEVDVRRRFAERWRSVKRILPYCDEAIFYDNDNGFRGVAEYIQGTLVLTGESHPAWTPELFDYLKRNK